MKETEDSKTQCEIVYSTDISQLYKSLHKGVCLHLICLSGEGQLTFNGNIFTFGKNDAVVISRPDLMETFQSSEELLIEYLIAPLNFLYNQLPANNYGVGGCISLWDNPIIHLSEADAQTLLYDFHRLRDRIGECGHLFYNEMIGSLALTMIYDLFDFHAKNHQQEEVTERKTDLVSQLVSLLSSGRCKQYREVAYYAELLNVSPKYLSNVVRRQTGTSVTALIDRHTVPLLIEYMKNSKLSLSQISDEFHFTSLSYFSRYVQKHLGMSPTEYRKSTQPQKTKR